MGVMTDFVLRWPGAGVTSVDGGGEGIVVAFSGGKE